MFGELFHRFDMQMLDNEKEKDKEREKAWRENRWKCSKEGYIDKVDEK